MAEEKDCVNEEIEGPDSELEYSTDPTRFNISLTDHDGQAGGYHVRNKDGEIQRAAISAFHGGFRKKPTFTVGCEAKAIIHGRMAPTSEKLATLLVYEFKFLSWGRSRIKAADILFEFCARPNTAGTAGPSVMAVRPHGQSRMGETIENQAAKFGLSLNLGPSIPGVDAGMSSSIERTTTKDVKYYTIITGDNPADMEWGDHYQAQFTLEENKSQESGIPTLMTAVILLQRENDEDFDMIPRIKVTPDLLTWFASLASHRAPDDPVHFRPRESPFNGLDGRTRIDPNNLGSADLDNLWICNMYNLYIDDVNSVQRHA